MVNLTLFSFYTDLTVDFFMHTSKLRDAFLDYFKGQKHEQVSSSSLVPDNDPTLLFTNAGMVQFKDCFLGQDVRSYVRAVSSQRCVRAGGKHNDLENVGYTARHHTFFEMLGNFSFGDYFKQDAIKYAWEFLTSEQWLNLPTEKLLVTVYAKDDEAYDIWHQQIGLPEDKIIRIGDNKGSQYASDNFWQMGDTGPCGPCSEIFYDHGEHIWGGPPGSPEEDGDRFIEIWNLVFMQYDRQADGTMHPLPKPSVDTGMGLERIAAVLQHVHSNYEIDLFQALIQTAKQVTGCQQTDEPSLKVIADHIRSTSFLIVDGVLPANEGRGYVLRRIIRRAIRHGHKLGAANGFFAQLVPTLVEQMGQAYPELKKLQSHVEKVLLLEEEQFAKTLERGMSLLDDAIANLTGDTLGGELVFKLYDTYGFPFDLTSDVARERNLNIDAQGFERAMQAQKQTARAAGQFKAQDIGVLGIQDETEFLGYEQNQTQGSIIALFKQGQAVDSLKAGEQGQVILDKSVFYGEAGGQIGDTGALSSSTALFKVQDTVKQHKTYIHSGKVDTGELHLGESVDAHIDVEKRQAIRLHHSATHLLHAALRQVLGEHVAQKGSLVSFDKLRFDFSHLQAVSADELHQIERIVNQQIRANTSIKTQIMNIEEAKSTGAMALFGEKYDEQVRVLTMGEEHFSIELCGGTHARNTGDLGVFKIVSETGVAQGVRRLEALAGEVALNWINTQLEQQAHMAQSLKVSPDKLGDKLNALLKHSREVEKELEQAKHQLAANQGSDLIAQAEKIGHINVLAVQLDSIDVPALRVMLDQLKNKLAGESAILLACENQGKVTLLAGVSKGLSQHIKAGDAIKQCAPLVDGRGGGKAEMAQAGGQNPAGINAALAQFKQWVQTQLDN